MTGLSDILPIIAQRSERDGVVIVTVIGNRSLMDVPAGARMAVFEHSEPVGGIIANLDSTLVEDARRCLSERRSRQRSYRLGPDGPEQAGVDAGDIDVFFEVLATPPTLVIVGCGHIALPLARIAHILEFEVIVVDDRPEFANRERFPDARDILIGPYRPTLAQVSIDANTYIVLVTRGHVHDQDCLEEVLPSDAAYIGMIGSKGRVRTVMRHLHADKNKAVRLHRIHAPIGLDIAAQTPEEIAVAIMAEIISVRRGGRSISLGLKMDSGD